MRPPRSAVRSGAVSEPLVSQDFYLVGRERPQGLGDEVRFRDLHHFPLVMGGRGNQLRIDLENTAAREGHRINIAFEQDSVTVYRSIVMNGPAYTVVPYSAFKFELEAGTLFASRIIQPSIERTLSLVWHESSDMSSSARAVMDLTREYISALVRRGDLRGRLIGRGAGA